MPSLAHWSVNATWTEFIVYPIPLPVGEFVLLFYNKGQILPALLNNSGARWVLVLLNFRILVFVRVSLSLCVCVWPAPALRRLVYRV